MSQTKNHCEPLVAIWLRPSTTEPCICCKQVAEKPRGEHLKMMYVCIGGAAFKCRHWIIKAPSSRDALIMTGQVFLTKFVNVTKYLYNSVFKIS